MTGAFEVKANGNTVDHDDYFLDGLLQHQIERKPGGTLVSEHTLDYDPNGNRKYDASKTMNADNHTALIQRVQTATYDPRDRIATLTKTDPTTSATVDSESYVHDANDNVISQTLTTTYSYDRNRLQTAVTGSTTASYNYDPWGRLDSVTSGTSVLQRNLYDGFDRVSEHRRNTGGGVFATTRYGYDPLDRTASKTDNAGTANAKTTNFSYLGLSDQIVDEQDTSGQVQRSYRSTPGASCCRRPSATPTAAPRTPTTASTPTPASRPSPTPLGTPRPPTATPPTAKQTPSEQRPVSWTDVAPTDHAAAAA